MASLAKRIGVATLLGVMVLTVDEVRAQNQTNTPPDFSSPTFRRRPITAPGTGMGGQTGISLPPAVSGYPTPPSYFNPGVGGGPTTATLTTRPRGDFPDPYALPGPAYPPTPGDPYGGYVSGAADALRNSDNYLINVQRARLIREQVRQARIDTQRRAFDEYLYERKNAPTWEDERERFLALSLRRSLNDPPLTEIWSGKALNDLLAEVQKQSHKGVSGPQFVIEDDVLRRINVSAGKSPGNIGLLKNDGKLSWPVALRLLKPRDRADDLRRQIGSLLPEAINQAVNGKVDPMSLKELVRATNELQDMLTRNVTNLPPGPYMDAKRFMTSLDDGVKLLQQPDAGLYFTQKYSAKGHSVPELVDYMTRTGLLFAPAVAGDEAAYVALHRALVAYAMTLRGRRTIEQR